MSAVRPRRVLPSAVNTPVSVKIQQTTCIDKSQAQLLLDQFLQEAESSDPILTQASTTNNATISQLKRCQRELRGLTPLLQDTVQAPRTSTITTTTTSPANKKIKFDDDVADAEVQDDNESGQVGKKIDKEERKRLKKERRKEERLKKQEEK